MSSRHKCLFIFTAFAFAFRLMNYETFSTMCHARVLDSLTLSLLGLTTAPIWTRIFALDFFFSYRVDVHATMSDFKLSSTAFVAARRKVIFRYCSATAPISTHVFALDGFLSYRDDVHATTMVLKLSSTALVVAKKGNLRGFLSSSFFVSSYIFVLENLKTRIATFYV